MILDQNFYTISGLMGPKKKMIKKTPMPKMYLSFLQNWPILKKLHVSMYLNGLSRRGVNFVSVILPMVSVLLGKFKWL